MSIVLLCNYFSSVNIFYESLIKFKSFIWYEFDLFFQEKIAMDMLPTYDLPTLLKTLHYLTLMMFSKFINLILRLIRSNKKWSIEIRFTDLLCNVQLFLEFYNCNLKKNHEGKILVFYYSIWYADKHLNTFYYETITLGAVLSIFLHCAYAYDSYTYFQQLMYCRYFQ